VEYEPPQVLGATTSGPEALDNLSDKGDVQVGAVCMLSACWCAQHPMLRAMRVCQ
jgi:hypothetical protein